MAESISAVATLTGTATDPTLTDMGPLAIDGKRQGDPVLNAASGGGFDLYFIRRKDGCLI